jgi:hypothetical protein
MENFEHNKFFTLTLFIFLHIKNHKNIMRSALVAHLVSLRKFQFSLGALCDAPKTPETSVC